MTREIKFRAWDKLTNRMSDNFTLFDIYAGRDESTIPDKDNMTFYFGDNELYDIIIMQYTGLKDKNGKEIYEGDILKNTKNHNQLVEVYWEGCVVDDVKWIQWGGWGFRKVKSDKNFLYAIYDGEIEVIGNIYENPELLKGI